MPHDKSISCLNKERDNGMVYCFAQGEKELDEQYQAVAGKKKKKAWVIKAAFFAEF